MMMPDFMANATASSRPASQRAVRVATLGVALALTVAFDASAADQHPTPSIPWVLAQALPSPEIAFGGGRAIFGLRWQVTPFLYSWGIHRSAPRKWRTLIVEPSMRYSGSFEVFGGPEWLRSERWLGRAGVRSYFPIADRGEALAISLGTSVWTDLREVGPSLEAGAHVLFGLFGVVLTHSSGLPRAEWTVTLQVRVL